MRWWFQPFRRGTMHCRIWSKVVHDISLSALFIFVVYLLVNLIAPTCDRVTFTPHRHPKDPRNLVRLPRDP